MELRSARAIAGLSLRELARRSGVAHTHIIRIENGQADPTIGTMERLLGPCRRRLVVSDGTAKASRLVAGALGASDSLARHAVGMLEIAATFGVTDLRRVPWATIREELAAEGGPDPVRS